MAVRKIRMWDDPVLKQECDYVGVKELKKIKRDLEDTLRKTDTGVGMAAPQIGILKRVIVVNIKGRGTMTFANPTIVSFGDETDKYHEGCLSYPDHYVEIERPIAIMLDWMNRKGKQQREGFGGFDARVIQHEMHHLAGVCLVGDAQRAGHTITGEQVRAINESKKKAPMSVGMLGAMTAYAAVPHMGRACGKSTDLIASLRARGLTATGRKMSDVPEYQHLPPLAPRCSRTACKRPGSGYLHRDLSQTNPGGFNNYCVRCARKINGLATEKVILTPDELHKYLSEGDQNGGSRDAGKPEEATI